MVATMIIGSTVVSFGSAKSTKCKNPFSKTKLEKETIMIAFRPNRTYAGASAKKKVIKKVFKDLKKIKFKRISYKEYRKRVPRLCGGTWTYTFYTERRFKEITFIKNFAYFNGKYYVLNRLPKTKLLRRNH